MKKVGELLRHAWAKYRRYSRIFWTEKTAYKLTVGVTDVKAKTRHVCRDSTWYMTPQRRAGETSKTLDVQLGFGRDRKPKRRRNDMDKKLRLHRDCKTRMLPSPVYVEHDDGCRRKLLSRSMEPLRVDLTLGSTSRPSRSVAGTAAAVVAALWISLSPCCC